MEDTQSNGFERSLHSELIIKEEAEINPDRSDQGMASQERCHVCGHVQFLSPHERRKLGNQAFSCSKCVGDFIQECKQKNGVAIRKGAKLLNFSTCEYKSSKSSDLNRYKSTHLGQEAFRTSQSDYKSNQLSA